MKLVTLGPSGTCSEEVSLAYAKNRPGAEVVLCPSFEEAARRVLQGEADEAIVPAAYVNFHEIVFQNVGTLRVRELLYSQPAFVLAARADRLPLPKDRPLKVASHRSPSPLLRRLSFPYTHVEAASNAVSARLAQSGEVDACITNRYGVETLNKTLPASERLEIVEAFGVIDMPWAVFERGAREDHHGAYFAASFDPSRIVRTR